MERCELCDMNVRNVKIHWKLNHRKKTSKKPGFMGFTPEYRKVNSPSRPVQEEPDIITRIVPPSGSSFTKSTVVRGGQPVYDLSITNTSTFDIERSRNISLLRELLDDEHEGVSRAEIEDIINSGGEIMSEKSFEFKLKIMGLLRMGKKYKRDNSGSSKFDECPDCHHKFQFKTIKLQEREYMDHVKDCGLDVGIGGGAIMKVIQNVLCEPKIESITEDLIDSQEIPSGLIKTEIMDFVKQDPKTNETASYENQFRLFKSEVIDNNVDQDSLISDKTNLSQQAVSPLLTVKKETDDCTSRQEEDFCIDNNLEQDSLISDIINLSQQAVSPLPTVNKKPDDCTSRQEDFCIVNNENLLGLIKSEVRKETESIVNCTSNLSEYMATRPKSLRIHKVNVHEGMTYYNCDQCEYKDKQRGKLRRHKESVHEGLTYDCDQCEYKCTRKDRLKTHKDIVHDGLTYDCDQCEYKTTRQGWLKGHKQSVHEGLTYDCDQCEYKATRQNSLMTHKDIVHDGLTYNCEQCEYKATRKGRLKRHKQNVHEGVIYSCYQCEFKATHPGSLKRHRRIVHERVTYSCDQCKYMGKRQDNLKQHKQIVHEGVTYSCDQCENKFTQQRNLKTHKQRIHEGVTYNCDQCEYKAKQQDNLKTHKQIVHEGLPYSCDQCTYKSKGPRNIIKHKLRVHDIVSNR